MENKKDLIEVPKTVLDTMEIIPIKNVDEVLKVALTKPLKELVGRSRSDFKERKT